VVILWAVLSMSCARNQPPETIQVRIEPTETPDNCMETCLHNNQMRAVAVEQIRADCETECREISDPTITLNPPEDTDNTP